MVRRLFVLTLVLGLLAVPSAFASASLRCPVGTSPHVLLAHGGTYGEGGATHVHRGADLAASAGSSVHACGDGVVTFTGSVPSIGSSQTARAVTMRQADGLKVTYMPLASIGVANGASVAAGATLGTLAAEGDGSSAEPHLHLSVRNGDVYLDPAPMITAVVPAAEPQPKPEPAAAPKTQPAAAPKPVVLAKPAVVSVPAQSPLQAELPSLSTRQTRVTAGEPLAAAPQVAARTAPVAKPATSARAAATTQARPQATRATSRGTSAASGVSGKAAYATLQRFATWAVELVIAAAFLWPAWRRMTRPVEAAAEPAPVRMRA